MVGRRVDGGELQRAISGIANIVPGSCRHENAIPCIQAALEIQLFLAGACTDKRLPAFHPNELVRVGVHFQTDLAAGGNIHQSHLQVASGPKCSTEVLIFPAAHVTLTANGAGP